jgi:hypothetical protein
MSRETRHFYAIIDHGCCAVQQPTTAPTAVPTLQPSVLPTQFPTAVRSGYESLFYWLGLELLVGRPNGTGPDDAAAHALADGPRPTPIALARFRG